MPALKMLWTDAAKGQFEELRKRIAETAYEAEFIAVHNEIVAILRDLDQAVQRGDPLYNTKKPGGIVRHFLHEFISVTYCIFEDQGVGWITKYVSVPAVWPEQGELD